MNIELLNSQEQVKYYDEILKMLVAGDDDFIPPLSARTSTTQSNLNISKRRENGILNYFDELKKQRIMVAKENDKLIAFVSFKENYTNEEIGEDALPNIYLSTLIVKPEGRGKGLTQMMYKILFKEYENANIFTRTWSTNIAHIKILSKFNFETLCVLKNHRGVGIDTVYFVKRPENNKFIGI